MKVKKLIEELAKLDAGLDVLIYSETTPVLDILNVSEGGVRLSRNKDEKVLMKFESDSKHRIAVMEVTDTF